MTLFTWADCVNLFIAAVMAIGVLALIDFAERDWQ